MSESMFEVDLASSFVEPIGLSDGRLLGLDRRSITKMESSDGGRTWQDAGRLVGHGGRPIAGDEPRRAYIMNLVRLNSGAIGLKFEVQQPGSTGILTRLDAFFSKSLNEGETWSEPVPITPSDVPTNATWLAQTSDGTLVLPNEYWFAQPGNGQHVGIGICSAFYSDDEGDSWSESRDSLWVWDEGGARQGNCEVPVVAETTDGRLLMFMRTHYQRIAQSYSTDDGRTWSHVHLNDLVNSNSEIYLARVPSTGDLLCLWNQATPDEIKGGYYRSRITSAISRDSGETWERFRTVVMSPGQERISRIVNLDPPGHIGSPGPADVDTMRADEFHMNRAPRVQFIQNNAYLVYVHRVYKIIDGVREKVHDVMRLRVSPVDWFYGDDQVAPCASAS